MIVGYYKHKKVAALRRRSRDWSAFHIPAKEELGERGRRIDANRSSARNRPQGRIARVYSLSLVRPRLFAEACLLKLQIIVGGSASS